MSHQTLRCATRTVHGRCTATKLLSSGYCIRHAEKPRQIHKPVIWRNQIGVYASCSCTDPLVASADPAVVERAFAAHIDDLERDEQKTIAGAIRNRKIHA